MELRRSLKVLLGLATLWTGIYNVVFLGAWVAQFFGTLGGPGGGMVAERMGMPLAVFLPLHMLTTLLAFVLIGVYVYLLFAKSQIGQSERLIWLAVILVGLFVGQLVFFIAKVWPDRRSAEPDAPTMPVGGSL